MKKNTSRCETPGNTPLEIEELLTADQRRPITVADHQHFIRSISLDGCGRDAIDRALDELIEVDPYVSGTNYRRTDRELAKMLDLIDNLPISDAGKEGQA